MNLLKLSRLAAALVLSLPAVVFSANSISIETPLPGTVFKAGTVCNVTWAWEGEITAVDIYLSADNGATWKPLALYYDNKGSFTCFIPYFTAPQCRIRVADSEGTAEDISGIFSLLAGTLSVTAPKIDSATTVIFHGVEVTVPIWLKNTGEALILLNSNMILKSTEVGVDWLAVSPDLPRFLRPGDSLQYIVTLNKSGVFVTDTYLKGLIRIFYNSATESFDIPIDTKVRQFNIAPYFDAIRLNLEVAEGSLLTEPVHAFDSDGDPLTLSAQNLPEGAQFVDNHNGSGLLTWQTDYSDSGFFSITYSVSDGQETVNAICYIWVKNTNRLPVFTMHERQFAKVGKKLEYIVAATDADDDPLTLAAVTLPAGATFIDNGNGTGLLTFTPSADQIGDLDIEFEVSDGTGPLLTAYEFTVEPATPVAVTSCAACAPGSPAGDILVSDPIVITFSHAIRENSLPQHVSIVSRRDGNLPLTFQSTPREITVLPLHGDFSPLDTIEITITAGLTSYTDDILQSSYTNQVVTGPVVYPGDLDNNGVVDERDILPIGAFFGATGPSRTRYDADDYPRPEPAHRWAKVAASYADANGSGKVDVDDICVVTKYFGWQKGESSPANREPLDLAASSFDGSRLGDLRAALSGCPPSFGQEFLLSILGGSNTVVEEALPKTNELFANYPNPFNPSTTIAFQLAAPGHVHLTIYNVMGQVVRTLIDERRDAGEGTIEWNGCDQSGATVASGVYFYRLEAGAFTRTRQLLLLK